MELARSFTTRMRKQEMHITSPMHIGRAASQRAGRPVMRSKISGPLALVSTSNLQLNNARHIVGTSPIENRTASSGSSLNSITDHDSDASSNHNSGGTVTDASSIDESPIDIETLDNHLSCYFKPAVDTLSRSPSMSPVSATFSNCDTPKLPQRANSHSKKAHESLHRKNSIRRIMSPAPPASACELSSNSNEICSQSIVEAPKDNPFSSELAQLDEVAEEFGQVVHDAETAADISAMQACGLARYAASDYLSEIHDLIHTAFGDATPNFAGWI
ncbi:hypothetical protein LTR62_006549 [Meristemomyces frigidus]|uniref:Uncharacterized protein n=1 Tax=Meristemomyces frigidus TaxID=1508187 RepID=A0AAN7TG60_9PEZI|nr:hypothetical protein LTR62_006549 [Meristemomyces frigidus]